MRNNIIFKTIINDYERNSIYFFPCNYVLALVAGSAYATLVICICVGFMGFGSVPPTMDQTFYVLKIKT